MPLPRVRAMRAVPLSCLRGWQGLRWETSAARFHRAAEPGAAPNRHLRLGLCLGVFWFSFVRSWRSVSLGVSPMSAYRRFLFRCGLVVVPVAVVGVLALLWS